MPHPDQADVRNRLLKILSEEDYAILQPHLERVPLILRDKIMDGGKAVPFVYFVEEGLVSLVAETNERIEVGMIGREGLAGLSSVLDGGPSLLSGLVQAEGSAYRMKSSVFNKIVRERGTILDIVLRYVHFLLTQAAETAYANASFDIEQRLARWILMTHDRLETDDLPMTHDFLSLMLGTRRSSVTAAVHLLEGKHMIRATRGMISVRSRAKLSEQAGAAYGLAEAEYDRMLRKR